MENEQTPQPREEQQIVYGTQSQSNLNNKSKIQQSLMRTIMIKTKKPITEWRKSKILAWEFFGTAILAYGICAASNSVHVSLSVLAGILMTAPFSGGHLNAAVSFGLFLKGEMDVFELLFRAIGQVFGALFGGFLSFIVLNKVDGPIMQGLKHVWRIPFLSSSKQIGEDGNAEQIWGISNAFMGETIGTFALVFIVLLMTDKRTTLYSGKNQTIPFFTIVAVYHVARAYTPRTGGNLNPCTGFSLIFWKSIYDGDSSIWGAVWIYIASSFFGAFLAGIYYNWAHFPLALSQDTAADRYAEYLEQVKNEFIKEHFPSHYEKFVLNKNRKQNENFQQDSHNQPRKSGDDIELSNLKTPLKDDY